MRKLLILPIFLMSLFTFGIQPASALSLNGVAVSGCSGGFSQSKCSACSGLTELGSAQDCSGGKKTVDGLIKTIIYILSWLVGIIAVIMLIISGIKFATAGGDSNSVSSAKSTLIWALVGLFVVALAQGLARWTLNTSSNISQTSSSQASKK